MNEPLFEVVKKMPFLKYWIYFVLIETVVISAMNPFLKYANFGNYFWLFGYLATNFGTALGYSLWAFLFCALYRLYIKVFNKSYSYKTDTNLLFFGIGVVLFAMYGLYGV
jgi:hypothetical protein